MREALIRVGVAFSGTANLMLLAAPVDGWPWWARVAGIVGLALTLKAWRSFKEEPVSD